MTSEEVEKFLNNLPGLMQSEFFLHSQIKRWKWSFSSIVAFQLDLNYCEIRTVTDGICVNFFDEVKSFLICSKMLYDQPRFLVSSLTPERLQEIVDKNLAIHKKAYAELTKRTRSVLIDEL